MLYLEPANSGRGKKFGPVSLVRIEGDSVRAGAREVAVYRGGLWVGSGFDAASLVIEAPLSVHFETGYAVSPSYGTFERVRIVDGVLRAGEWWQLTLARFDPDTRMWCVPSDQTAWFSVMFSPLRAALPDAASRAGLLRSRDREPGL
jgi:hypothetical protein